MKINSLIIVFTGAKSHGKHPKYTLFFKKCKPMLNWVSFKNSFWFQSLLMNGTGR